MTTQAHFSLRGRNPDVLTCIANLSNDEVFTPPELANQMLDTLAEAWAETNDGADIWADKTVTFLDPFTKSGVFLREITSRLTVGLADEIPNLEERVEHILTKQVFGIAITQLTSLLARRSLYCSKFANGEHSIAQSFDNLDGNVWFERMEHTWDNNKCKFCSATKATLDRDEERENYAYAFIHTDNIKARIAELFGDNMQFDVIIGNPPYQMKGGAGGSSDSSIYHLFVEQAQKLEPKFLSMVIPSRWLAGGRGLGDFRKEMLSSKKILKLVDYPISKEVFPNVEIMGGVCFFLWSNSHNGKCEVSLIRKEDVSTNLRTLDEYDIYVRDSISIGILQKVLKAGEPSVSEFLTADTPFGIATNFDGFHSKKRKGDVPLYYVRSGKRNIGFIKPSAISKNIQLIDTWKVLAPEAHGAQKIPIPVLGKPWLAPKPSVTTQTFLAFCMKSQKEALNFESYYCTKFFRFLVSLRKITQHALKSTYIWVPQQSWDRKWTDELLYKKYQFTKKEISHIEEMISPMEPSGKNNG